VYSVQEYIQCNQITNITLSFPSFKPHWWALGRLLNSFRKNSLCCRGQIPSAFFLVSWYRDMYQLYATIIMRTGWRYLHQPP
jgi:hypothetical protein